MKFSVVEFKTDKVIESGFKSKEDADEFAADFGREYHCHRPSVVKTLKSLKPGHKVNHLDVA